MSIILKFKEKHEPANPTDLQVSIRGLTTYYMHSRSQGIYSYELFLRNLLENKLQTTEITKDSI